MDRIERRTYRLSLCFPGSTIELRFANGETSKFKLLDPKTGRIESDISNYVRVRALFDDDVSLGNQLTAGARALFIFDGVGYLPTPRIVEIFVNGQLVATAPRE